MTERPFDDCLTLALALCGVPDANTVEVNRVKAFINLAARRAYDESDYWPRWLRTEERIVSEDGLLPYSEDGKDDIGVCRRIFATEPFADCGAAEYPNFYAKDDGIQIAGYVAREVSDFRAPMLVTGTVSPNLNGTYQYTGQGGTGEDGTTNAPEYQSDSNEANTLFAGLSFLTGVPPTFLGYRWNLRGSSGSNYWRSDTSVDYTTPDLATGNYVAQGLAIDGGVTITKIATYSAWVTYKAAFSTTYAAGDDFPAEWFDFAANWAAAKFFIQDGKPETAAIFNQEAGAYLQAQLEKLDNQSGGHVFTRNINHANTQAR